MADSFASALADRFRKKEKPRRWASPLWMAADLEGMSMPRHQRYIDDRLVAMESPDGPDKLAISLPPQHGKSTLATIWYVLWLLDHNPDLRIVVVCYNADFAAHFGWETKQIIDKHADTLGWSVAPDSKANNLWRVKGHRGGCMYIGVGGGITGWAVDRIINDDWIKNHEEGFNAAHLEKCWVFYEAVIEQRIQHGVKVVMCMTRWAENDPIGKVIQTAPHEWEVVNLPARAKENDPLGRQPGEGLWLEKNPQEWYDNKQAKLGAFIWAALYQQEPAPEAGGILKKIHYRYYQTIGAAETSDHQERWMLWTGQYVEPADCVRFGTADTATSTKTSADWTVVGAWAVTPLGDLLLVDMLRARMEEDDLPAALLQFMFRNSLPWIGVESTFFTSDLAYQLGRMGVRFQSLKADQDKVQRALPLKIRLEQHRLHFPASASWLGELEKEFLLFTGKDSGSHDDIVDMCAYASRHLDTSASNGLGKGRKKHQRKRTAREWQAVSGV